MTLHRAAQARSSRPFVANRSGTAALLAVAFAGALSLIAPAQAACAARTVRSAQSNGTAFPPVPRFEIANSPVQLSGPVRPGEYLGVTGPRSAWLGLETGEAELWVHPLKVASGFRLSFSVPRTSPVPAARVARAVHVRPEMATVVYSHAAFQVRQHVLAPAESPGLLILLEVDAPEPIEIAVEFQPVLNHMWPGSIGGQYAYWDDARRFFVLSESLQEHNAVVGSPWAANSVEHPAHQLGEAPRTMIIPVDPDRARREFIPVVAVAGTMPRDSVFAAYRRLLAEAESLYRGKRAWADSVLASTVSLESPEPELDLALEWAKINLEEQRVCNPDLGCGFVAGWGLSRSGTRPGFGWFFGGDAAINTFAMDALGQWELVAEELAFLARYQRADGKITHEISQAAARIDWFETYPYAYYHADTTPYWMAALHQYWRASGDDALLRTLWPAYRRAWEWCLSAETDGDGIIENTVGGLGAVEVGGLGEAIHQDIYLAAVWLAALEGTIELAAQVADAEVAAAAGRLAPLARKTLNESYWREDEGHHAFAVLAGGGTNDNLTVWPAAAAAFRLLDEQRARATLTLLASDRISSDWGARMLSTESSLYHPLQYNMGTVWPFVTGFVSWGQYRYRRPWAGFHLMDAVKQMTFDWSLGRHGELFSGSFYQPLDQTVPHQFFASSMLATPLIRGVFGWDPDAPSERARLAPQLPPEWPRAVLRRLRVGGSSVDVALQQRWTADGGEMTATIDASGPAFDLQFVPGVPLGARDVRVLADGASLVPELNDEDGYTMTVGGAEGDQARREVQVLWRSGLAVSPPRAVLDPGQRSTGLRVLDVRFDPASTGGSSWVLSLEGTAGRSYDLDLFGATVEITAAEGPLRPQIANRDPAHGFTRLRLDFGTGEGEGRVRASVRLSPS